MSRASTEAPEEVLDSRMELSDLGSEVFLGDPRLAENCLPFNANPSVGWGKFVSAMVV